MDAQQTLTEHRRLAEEPDDATYPFDAAPVALWDEDWLGVHTYFEQLRRSGVAHLGTYFEERPDEIDHCISLIKVRRVNGAARELFALSEREATLGRIPTETITPAGRHAFARQFECMYDGGSSLEIEMTGQRHDGRETNLLLQWSLRVHEGEVDASRSLVSMTDITSRIASQRRLQELLTALSGIYDIGHSPAQRVDLDGVLVRVVDAAASLLRCGLSCILLVDEEAQRVTSAVGHGVPADALTQFDYSTIRSGLLGVVIESHASVVSPDVANDDRSSTKLGRAAARNGLQSLAASPVIVDGEVVGVLVTVGSASRAGFSVDDVDNLELLASQAAVAITNARTFDSMTSLNQELESALELLRSAQSSLVHAQKLEAVGALAAGIAHEINTPIQYVGDNVRFLRDSFSDLLTVEAAATELATAASATQPDAAATYQAAAEEADTEFLAEEIPPAIEQTLEGVQRVAAIVRALKDFAHPGGDDLTPTDVNRALENTATVARNEWKYVADLELVLDPELPLVPALAGPLNQSFLIIIVNAAQAIGERLGDDQESKGRIQVSTAVDGEFVEIRFADDGGGIPDEIRHRIFEPFFTTKEVGKGSGQGLSIAHQVVTEQHAGTLEVEVDPGVGSTFVIRLPREVAT